jgi:hypothetical protein
MSSRGADDGAAASLTAPLPGCRTATMRHRMHFALARTMTLSRPKPRRLEGTRLAVTRTLRPARALSKDGRAIWWGAALLGREKLGGGRRFLFARRKTRREPRCHSASLWQTRLEAAAPTHRWSSREESSLRRRSHGVALVGKRVRHAAPRERGDAETEERQHRWPLRLQERGSHRRH